MSYVTIPMDGYDLVVNTDRLCYLQDSDRGMALSFAGLAAPLLLTSEEAGYVRAWLYQQADSFGGLPEQRRGHGRH